MKLFKIVLAAFLLFSLNFSFAQSATVKVTIVNPENNKVEVVLPLNGEKFFGNKSERTLDVGNAFSLTFTVNKIGFIQIINSGSYYKFYIEPGISTIVLDPAKKGSERVHFTGKSSAGQEMINGKSNPFYQYAGDFFYKKDSTVVGIKALIATDKAQRIAPYDQLLAEKKISQVFYDYVKNDLKFYYNAILGYVPAALYSNSIRPGGKPFKPEFGVMWAAHYKENPITDLNGMNSDDFYDAARDYVEWYKNHYEAKLNGTYKARIDNNETAYLVDSYLVLGKYFTGKMKEYMQASFLYNEMFQKKFQSVLVELYYRFKRENPSSIYINSLTSSAALITAYHETARKDFTPAQQFVPNYSQINTLDELAANFKGKTVYVDIWATWCGPCKAEFAYKKELEKFIEGKNATVLYISMDKDEADKQWKDMIKYYNLSGNHIRTNVALQKNLMDKLWDGKGYSIPRYLILKDGKMVVSDALRPSDKAKLYEQLGAHL